MGIIGKTFKKEAKAVTTYLSELQPNQVEELQASLGNGSYKFKLGDKEVSLTKDMVSVKKYQKTIHVEEIIPSVIEPSFGVGRVMYAVFEHNFRCRDNDEQRTYLTLPAIVAPIKCSVLPLSGNTEFHPFVKKLCKL